MKTEIKKKKEKKRRKALGMQTSSASSQMSWKFAFQGLLLVASICWRHFGKATDAENLYLGAQVDSGKLLNLIQHTKACRYVKN